ncbi:MAG: tetratricopeptide repeat protein [Bacteroidota bacterium]|nr:tetratricopeptide repeat protein [Bacteroidota bacterium]
MKKLVLLCSFILLLGITSKGQINAERYSYIARTRIYFGNYAGAIDYLNQIIRVRPNLPEPYFLRGAAKQFLDDYRGAKIDFDRAIEIKPFYPDAYLNRAMTEYELKDYKSSMEDYSRALELDPLNDNVYNNRGIAKLALKDTLGAMADYNKAIEINPQNINPYLNRSIIKQQKKDLKGAIADIDQAIKIKPNFAGAFLGRGIAEFELNNYAEALSDYDECIYNDPENALAYSNRGIVKHKLGDFEGAIFDYNKAITLDPSMAHAYMNRGLAKEALNRKDFMSDFKMAAKLDPRYAKNPYLVQVNPRAYQQSQLQQQQQNQNARKVGSAKAAPGGNASASQQNTAQQQQAKTNDQNTNTQTTANNAKNKTVPKKRSRNVITVNNEELGKESKNDENSNKLQNKNIDVKLESIFEIALAMSSSEQNEKMQYYNLQVEELNQFNKFEPMLRITNRDFNEEQQLKEDFENNIRYFNAKLSVNNKNSNNYLNKGIFESLTTKYNDALNDFDQAIKIDNNNTLAYFERANVRSKMVDLILSLPDFSERQILTVRKGVGNVKTQQKVQTKIQDYDLAISDYQKVLDLNPHFLFALFNRANIYCKTGEYKKAEEDYSRIIELEPDFGEAYFNRGLVRIYLDEPEKGAMDLSKAGELGIQNAYNIIKRYCN